MAQPKHFVLLGAKAGQESLDSRLYNQAFAAWGIPADLRDLPLQDQTLPAALAQLRQSGFSGGAVATAWQLEIIPLLDKLSPLAQRVGAVDTLYWEGQALVGHNALADAFAFPLYQQNFNGQAVILGDGPAARSALSALLCLPEISEIFVCPPALECDLESGLAQARQIAASVLPAKQDEHSPHKISLFKKGAAIAPSGLDGLRPGLLVNCAEFADQFDIPWQVYQEKGLAYDFQIGNGKFLDLAQANGWKVLDGLDMFLSAAKERFILWTGLPLPDIAEQELRAHVA